MSQFGHRARAIFDRAFPERQIYHRSGGTVRYISLSPSKQAVLALGGVVVSAWFVYASAQALIGAGGTAGQNVAFERLQQKYTRHISETRAQAQAAQAQLQERTANFERATADFEKRHQVLRELLTLAGGPTLTAAARPIERDDAGMLPLASIDEADPRESRGLAEPAYRVQSVGFRARIDHLEQDQMAALNELEDAVVGRTEETRAVLSMTGLSVARIAGDTSDLEMGGPLVADDLREFLRREEVDPAFANRVQEVAARLNESNRLDSVRRATPLAVPVASDYRETSGFGPRVDPFNGRAAMHAGLDLAAFERAPIVSSSPGVVVYAGVKSGFGNVVEIDHGHEFRTRYAHLRDIQVSVGQRVEVGQRIGSMGSTGRSTGTHLHYEIWFRGRPFDPVLFMRAGRHVHEQG